MKKGLLCICDKQGNNAEPIYPNDTPEERDEYIQDCTANGAFDPDTIRETTGDDGLDAKVDYVTVNENGEITGYYRWREINDVKFAVFDRRNNGTGDEFCNIFDDEQKAVDRAESDWCHLTKKERSIRTITVERCTLDDDGCVDYSVGTTPVYTCKEA